MLGAGKYGSSLSEMADNLFGGLQNANMLGLVVVGKELGEN